MTKEKKAYFYVVVCQDQSLYAGYTTNLTQRLKAHNSGKGAKYTRSRRPVHLIYAEQWASASEAMKQEYWFKQLTRLKKEEYLMRSGVVPPFRATTHFVGRQMTEPSQTTIEKELTND